MQRLLPLDLAKGFTVLFIPAVHCVMLYSDTSVHQSVFGHVLAFIAEWPGAQVFMFLMGMSFSFSKKPARHHIKKALLLLVVGYLLNVLKFLLPLWTGVFPVELQNELLFYHQRSMSWNLFLTGDIFHFAALALLVMTVIKQSSYYLGVALAFVFVLTVFTPLFWDHHHGNVLVDQLLHLVGGQAADSFFPLVPWIVYPLTGMAIGRYFQLPYASVQPLFFSGCFLFIVSALLRFTPFQFPTTSFYRTFPDGTNMHLGFVIIWVCLWFWMAPLASRNNVLVQLFCFCSRHISLIYFIQWPVIFWMLSLVGYRCLSLGGSILVTSIVYGIVFGMVYFIVGKSSVGCYR